MQKKTLYKPIIVIILFLFITPVKSLNFPSEITVTHSNKLHSIDNFSLYKKYYTSGSLSGKAFCTTFWKEVPISGTKCTVTHWDYSSGNSKDIPSAAAVGSIISSFRSSDGSMTWDNYFYTEIAINEFLHKTFKTTYDGKEVNNISGNVSKAINQKVKKYVDKARNIYLKYNKDSFSITQLTLNGSSITNGQTKTIEKKTNAKYIIKAVMKCYDDYDSSTNKFGNQIACDLPKVNVTVGGKKISDAKKTVKTSGKSTIITIDITSAITNGVNNIQLDFSNKRKYKYAPRYNCGNDYQSLTPNHLQTDYSKIKKLTKKFKINITQTTSNNPPSTENPPKTCEEALAGDSGVRVTYYNKASNKEQIAKMLDYNSPSCEPVNYDFDADCDKTTLTNEYVSIVTFDQNTNNEVKRYQICKATFNFDNLVDQNNASSSGELLFSTKSPSSNVFGKATINYYCNVPSLFNETYKNNLKLNIDNILPGIKVTTSLNQNGTTIYADKDSIEISGSNSYVGNDNLYYIENYRGKSKGFGWHFTVSLNYIYGDENKYMVSDESGNLVKWQPNNDIYGYGILVPDSTSEVKDGKMNLEFNIQGKNLDPTIGSSNTIKNPEATCSYELNNNNIKNDLKYRTIDVDNAFNKLDGNSRYTGSNWCSSLEQSENETDEKETDWELGDVNLDHEIDNEDIDLLGLYIAHNSVSDALIVFSDLQIMLADFNKDGQITDADIIDLNNYVNSDAAISTTENNSDVALDDSSVVEKIDGAEGLEIDTINSSLKGACSSDNKTVEKYIKNRPNANGKNPIYSFKLTPSTIKKIREYNKNNSVSGYSSNLSCTNNVCVSSFLTNMLNGAFSTEVSGLCTASRSSGMKCDIDNVLEAAGLIGKDGGV